MSRNLNKEEIENVLNLSGPKRYDYFIKFVCDVGYVWGLYNDGWALVSGDSCSSNFAVWPSKEYAVLCSDNEWKGYTPERISVDEFVNSLIPQLAVENMGIVIFPTGANKGIFPEPSQLLEDLKLELSRYE